MVAPPPERREAQLRLTGEIVSGTAKTNVADLNSANFPGGARFTACTGSSCTPAGSGGVGLGIKITSVGMTVAANGEISYDGTPITASVVKVSALRYGRVATITVQPQGTVWYATLTVDNHGDLFGCNNFGTDLGNCSAPTVLTADDFTYGGTRYRVVTALWDRTRSLLVVNVNTLNNMGQASGLSGAATKTALGALTLHVDGSAFAVSDATTTTSTIRWSFDPDPDWTDGQTVAVRLALLPPAAPASLAAHPYSADSVVLAWNKSNNATITKYQYRRQPASSSRRGWSAWTDIAGSNKDTFLHVVSGLDANVEYTFNVRAVNGAGNGSVSQAKAAPKAVVTCKAATATGQECTVAPDWPLIPSGVSSGSFRLMFVTGGTIAATSADIATYNTRAQRHASDSPFLHSFKDTFRALVSTSAVNARANTLTRSGDLGNADPIYWVMGDKIADNYADLYDGSWDYTGQSGQYPRTETGGSILDQWEVWTGTTSAGASHTSNQLGAATATRGKPNTAGQELQSGSAQANSGRKFLYAISPVLTIPPAPTVDSIRITSSPRAGTGNTYGIGDAIEVTFTFSKAIVVPGRPRLWITVDGEPRKANCARKGSSGDDARKLVCRYTVVEGDRDDNGISLLSGQLKGNIKDSGNNDAILIYTALGDQSGHKVEGVKPVIQFPLTVPRAGGTYTIRLSDAGAGVDGYLAILVDGVSGSSADCDTEAEVGAGNVIYQSSNPSSQTYPYRIPAGSEGKRVCVYAVDAVGNVHSELWGTLIAAPLPAVTPVAGTPRVSSVGIVSTPAEGDTYGSQEYIEIAVTFDSDRIEARGTPTLKLHLGGTAGEPGVRYANFSYVSEDNQAVFNYRVVMGDKDADGISIPVNAVTLPTASDYFLDPENGEQAVVSSAALSANAKHKVDGPVHFGKIHGENRYLKIPAVYDLHVLSRPASGDTYRRGERIRIAVDFAENIPAVDGKPTLLFMMGSEIREAEHSGQSQWGDRLVFTYVVRPGDRDADGISIPENPIQVNEANRIFNGHNWEPARLTHAALGDQSHAKVDTLDLIQGFAAAHGGNSVTLTWTDPAPCAAPGCTYEFRYRAPGPDPYDHRWDERQSLWSDWAAVSSPHTVTGLLADTWYDFEVRRSVTESGVTTVRAKDRARVYGPDLIQGLAAAPGKDSVTLSWTDPAPCAAPDCAYEFRYRAPGSNPYSSAWDEITASWSAWTTLTSGHTVSGLTADTWYDFEVRRRVTESGVTTVKARDRARVIVETPQNTRIRPLDNHGIYNPYKHLPGDPVPNPSTWRGGMICGTACRDAEALWERQWQEYQARYQ